MVYASKIAHLRRAGLHFAPDTHVYRTAGYGHDSTSLRQPFLPSHRPDTSIFSDSLRCSVACGSKLSRKDVLGQVNHAWLQVSPGTTVTL